MIVCNRYKFIFIGLPKCASTSVAIALSGVCGPEDVITKISDKDEAIRQELGYRGPQNYLRPFWGYPLTELFQILIDRCRPHYKHPMASAVRRFVGKETWKSHYKFCIERNPFDRVISRYYYDKRIRPLPDINDYVCTRTAHVLSNWKRYTIAGAIAVDYIARYEDLESELVALSDRLSLPGVVLPHTKSEFRQDHQHYSRILNSSARRHIESICKREIEHFSYQWVDAG